MNLLIGATGYLGQHLKDAYKPVTARHRFEHQVTDWTNSYDQVDTVWLVARACRKQQPRRDYITFSKEVAGVATICRAFPNAHIVYTSTKVVYGITDNEVKPVSRQDIGKYFVNAKDYKNQTIDVPFGPNVQDVDITSLSEHHQWYAMTKLACEQIVHQQSHTILRIWDIK